MADDRMIEMPIVPFEESGEDSLERPIISDFGVRVRDWVSIMSGALDLGNRVYVPDERYPYAIVMLSRGFIALIDKRLAQKASRHTWTADLQYDAPNGSITRVYAYTKVRIKGKVRKVYLHRYVANAGAHVVVNHFNCLTLDCRLINLEAVDVGHNNRHVERAHHRSNPGLKCGVEWRSGCFRGKIKVKGTTIRSRRGWNDSERAAVWYRRMHRLIFRHDCITVAIERADWPELPSCAQAQIRSPAAVKAAIAKPPNSLAELEDCPF